MASTELVDVLRVAKDLGYTMTREGKHIKCTHPKAQYPVTLPVTPSDHRGPDNAIHQLREAVGLSLKGREAVVGNRRKKKRRTPKKQEAIPPAVEVTRKEQDYIALERLMRRRPN